MSLSDAAKRSMNCGADGGHERRTRAGEARHQLADAERHPCRHETAQRGRPSTDRARRLASVRGHRHGSQRYGDRGSHRSNETRNDRETRHRGRYQPACASRTVVAVAALPALVLVVDDEPMVREVVAEYLRRDGLQVHELGDGTAALEWLQDHRPDLVVLDIMLPGTDGLGVLRRIRAAATSR